MGNLLAIFSLAWACTDFQSRFMVDAFEDIDQTPIQKLFEPVALRAAEAREGSVGSQVVDDLRPDEELRIDASSLLNLGQFTPPQLDSSPTPQPIGVGLAPRKVVTATEGKRNTSQTTKSLRLGVPGTFSSSPSLGKPPERPPLALSDIEDPSSRALLVEQRRVLLSLLQNPAYVRALSSLGTARLASLGLVILSSPNNELSVVWPLSHTDVIQAGLSDPTLIEYLRKSSIAQNHELESCRESLDSQSRRFTQLLPPTERMDRSLLRDPFGAQRWPQSYDSQRRQLELESITRQLELRYQNRFRHLPQHPSSFMLRRGR